jgi:hypothetical protein
MHSMAPRKYGLYQGASASEFCPSLRRRRPVECWGGVHLLAMENTSSRNTGTFTDFAIPRDNGMSLKLTCKCTYSKPTSTYPRAAEKGRRGWRVLCLRGYAHIRERIWSVLGLAVNVWGGCEWVRKSVPAATTRRERLEGENVGVGDGERRDSTHKHVICNSLTESADHGTSIQVEEILCPNQAMLLQYTVSAPDGNRNTLDLASIGGRLDSARLGSPT